MESRIICGHVVEQLRMLPANSVQTVVTSPPYFGLRSYGTEPQVWGGDPTCEHVWGLPQRTPWANDLPGPNGRKKNTQATRERVKTTGPYCEKCGAWLGELGQEPKLMEYVSHIADVFDEVRRVLRKDGTLWLNISDSYSAASTHGGKNKQGPLDSRASLKAYKGASRPFTDGLKPKDLSGIPWRVAFALQDRGWYLRMDNIWSKPNPMPDSTKDRCTRSHEYLFHFSKSQRYYYDADAIAEPAVSDHGSGNGFKRDPRLSYMDESGPRGNDTPWTPTETRNKRSVWTVPVVPNRDEHFAQFPPKLIEPCILGGSREGDTVLDPFAGRGTALIVAHTLGRRYCGIELNPKYVKIAERNLTLPDYLWSA